MIVLVTFVYIYIISSRISFTGFKVSLFFFLEGIMFLLSDDGYSARKASCLLVLVEETALLVWSDCTDVPMKWLQLLSTAWRSEVAVSVDVCMCVQGSQIEDSLHMTSNLSLWCVELLCITPFLLYIIIIIIVVVIIIIIIIFPFTQGIYIYIPETNHVCRAYGVAAVLYLQTAAYTYFAREICFVRLH